MYAFAMMALLGLAVLAVATVAGRYLSPPRQRDPG